MSLVYVLFDTSDGENHMLGASTMLTAAEYALDAIVDEVLPQRPHEAWFHLASYTLSKFADRGADPVRVVFDGSAAMRVQQREIDAEDQEREYRACQAAGLSWPSEMP